MIASTNPATGVVVFETAAADSQDVARAVERAEAAAGEWAQRPVFERSDLLRRFARLVERDAAELAALIVAEVGKLKSEAEGEAEWTAISARWYADHPPRSVRRGGALVRPRPLGVIAAVTPWNAPLITPAWKWLPALVAGDTVVWKPSELSTGIAMAALERFHEAGLPCGVLQVLPGGPETARALVADPRIGGVHFTGSTNAGRAIAQAVAGRFVRCALEMGGLNVALVFSDADLDAAAADVAAAATAINGQKCTATRRVLVEADAAEAFIPLLAERFESLVPGDPAREATTLGPLITPAARDAAEREVARAVADGARIVARSPEPPAGEIDRRAFFRATVLADLAPGDRLRSEELFAPVVSVESFSDVEAAWRSANASPYGLSAAVFTERADIHRDAAERLRTGILAFNRRGDAVDVDAPFGGVKESGNGLVEGGEYVYAGLTDLQAVYGER